MDNENSPVRTASRHAAEWAVKTTGGPLSIGRSRVPQWRTYTFPTYKMKSSPLEGRWVHAEGRPTCVDLLSANSNITSIGTCVQLSQLKTVCVATARKACTCPHMLFRT